MSDTVAIRLPNWLGDTVMAVPTIRALRSAQPSARVLLAGPWATLLAEQGLGDVLVTYPRTWAGRLRGADDVRRFGPALAVLLPNTLEAAVAAWYWGAGRRVGFASGARGLFLTDEVAVPETPPHQIDEYLLLAERIGAPAVTREPTLTPPAESSERRQEVRQLLVEAGAAPAAGRRRVGVHLGAAYGPAKVWPARRMTEFCRAVADDGDRPVLLGTAAEQETAAGIQREAPAASLVGRDRPELLAAVLAEIDVLVSGDTGVAHLAAALGTPVVALFGPTDPARSAPRGPVEIVQHPVPCSPCFYRACPIDHPCLRGIEPVRVRDHARALAAAAA
jgi:lipopolysaccharide heptosyltransferase II